MLLDQITFLLTKFEIYDIILKINYILSAARATMHKKFGVHFYINIDNLEQILIIDENKNDELKHSFHQLDTFIASIEKFTETFLEDCVVEKFTTSRLHIYYRVECDDDGKPKEVSLKNAIVRVFQIICFSRCLVEKLKSIGKYKNAPKFKIGFGVDIGNFVEFEFKDDELTELTTIGSPANRAAKLQSVIASDKDNDILISKAFFDVVQKYIPEIASKFFGRGDLSSKIVVKAYYYDLTAYGGSIKDIEELIAQYSSWNKRKDAGLDFAEQKANQTNYGDIDFTSARKPIDFNTLSLRAPKVVEGAMFYSDIRGFTNKVDMSKLQEAERFTKTVLEMMYDCEQADAGVHIQFQGDRDSVVFYNHSDMSKNYAVSAVVAGMKMLDGIDNINKSRNTDKINIGIGIAIGNIFLSRLGLKNGKFNIALGQTVRDADKAEDEKAGTRKEGQLSEIAITSEVFQYISSLAKDNILAKNIINNFTPFSDSKEFYVTSTKYSQLFQKQEDVKVEQPSLFPVLPHREKLPWILPNKCICSIKCQYSLDDENYVDYEEGTILPKHASLIFVPSLLPQGWKDANIKWQVTNTGAEAAAKGQLRGGIESSNEVLRQGKYIGRRESTEYQGVHYIQCFFVKNNRDCEAMSRYFEVRIGAR